MLGAGIRLGEAIIGSDRPLRLDQNTEIDSKLAVRLGALENRLRSLEVENPGLTPEGVSRTDSHLESQAADVASLRSQLNVGDRELAALSDVGLRLRGELRVWLEESVGARMADVEAQLRTESERNQRQMLDAFVDSIQTRVTHRISRLEEEVAGQSASMAELRECSMRSEQSMQKLLGGLDRLIVAQPSPLVDTPVATQVVTPPPVAAQPEEPPAQSASPESIDAKTDSGTSTPVETASPGEAQPRAESEPPVEPRPKSRRWSIFG